MTRQHLAIIPVLALLGLSACAVASASHASEATSELEVAFTNAPSEGSCLRITIDGPHRDVRNFDIAPGQGASFSLGNIPTSTLKVWADAYPVASSQVSEGAPASFFTESVSVTVKASAVAHIALSLLRNDQPGVSVDAKKKPASQPRPGTKPAT